MPIRLGRAVLRRGAAPAAQASVALLARGTRAVAAGLTLRDAEGAPVAVLDGVWFQRLPRTRADPTADAFHTALLPAPASAGAPAPSGPDPARAGAAVAARAPDPGLAEAALLLEGYALAAAHAALSARPAALADRPGRATAELVADLAAEGLLRPTPGGGWATVPDAGLPDPAAIWRQALAERPALAADLAWLAAARARLHDMLDGRPVPLPEPGPGPAALGTDRLRDALSTAARAWAAGWPADRPLRVLELAAPGDHGVAEALGAALRAGGLTVAWTRVGGAAASTDDGVVTIAWDPLGGAPPPGECDLLLGMGVVAALPTGAALAPLLEGLAGALAPGGTLLLAEPLPGRVWRFAGGSAPPDAAAWGAALAAAGLTAPPPQALVDPPWPAALIAARAPQGATPLAAPASRRVLLVAGPSVGVERAELAALLGARGVAVEECALADAASLPPRALAGRSVVVLLTGAQGTGALGAILAALARLAAAAEGSCAGFRLVTEGAAQAYPGAPDFRQRPEAAALFAAGRVLANEHPGLRPRRIDLPPGLGAATAMRRLLPELLHDGEAERVLPARGGVLVPRLRHGLPPAPALPGPRRLVQSGRRLVWDAFVPRAPAADEVLIRVAAAGLNFRDVMWTAGLLPEELLLSGFTGPALADSLGMECAGVVEAAGGASPWRPGDAVFGIAPGAIATHAVTRSAALVALPDGLDPCAAAALPVAYLTALYALEELGALEPGERVLIHGGAGAVGLAALAVAAARGARVAASAGSPAKRAFLRECGAELVVDSRDPGFADAVRAAWGGSGAGAGCVDVVLNALAGEAGERSLALVAPFGRFLELGKRDFVEGRRVPLRALRRNARWCAVDVDELPVARPALAARLLRDVADRVASGALPLLPWRAHAPWETERAFRALQAGTHLGKLVIEPPAFAGSNLAASERAIPRSVPAGPVAVPAGASSAMTGLDPAIGRAGRDPSAESDGRLKAGHDGAGSAGVAGASVPDTGVSASGTPALAAAARGIVLVVGGTSGFGAATARWLALQGVHRLALLSRRGADAPGTATLLADLAAAGARASLHAADAADPLALDGVLAALRAEAPITGIVHAGAVYADGAAATLDPRRAQRVLDAKLGAALALDAATAADPLALILLFGSAAATVGSPGQLAYAAANAGLEALARRRHAAGRPALCVAWGPIADAGVLAAEGARREALAARLGVAALPAATALAAVPALLAAGLPVAGLARFVGGAALPVLEEPAFAALAQAARPADAAGLRARLLAAGADAQPALLRDAVTIEVARILRLSPEAVPPDAPLAGLGLDSLGGMELRAALEAQLGAAVPLTAVDATLTVRRLADRLLPAVRAGGDGEAAAALLAAHEAAPAAAASSQPQAAATPPTARAA